MIPAFRSFAALALAAASGLACADDLHSTGNSAVDQTGDQADSFAAQYVSHGVREDKGGPANLAALELPLSGGWTAGSAAARADGRFVDNGRIATSLYAGYRGKAGPLGFSLLANWYSYPGARRALTGAGYDFTELSAGLRYRALYASYNTTLSHDFFGLPDARGSSYLDVGLRHQFDHATGVSLHAGDGHVAGNGNSVWDWRDMKAGLTHKLDGGWLLAMNYTRALGGAGPYDRYALAAPRADERPAFLRSGRRALVLSMARSF